MRISIVLVFACIGSFAFGQDQARYDSLVNQANVHYDAKDFAASAKFYSSAFEALGWKGSSLDRYNSACSWALANVPDSAFFQLFRITELMDFQDVGQITADADLVSLHADPRWGPVVARVKANRDNAQVALDRPLAHILDSIFDEDQRYRRQLDNMEKEYGRGSDEMKAIWRTIGKVDSMNLVLVSKMLDERGWLGADTIGQIGNSTLFLVIQHSDQPVQERYLPMMRAAVAKGNAEPSDLALLEDRVALGQGKKQIYGSQIGRDADTGAYYVSSLEDPDHVDERRASVGLGPLADYVGIWGIIWDEAAYKADLPALEARERAKK